VQQPHNLISTNNTTTTCPLAACRSTKKLYFFFVLRNRETKNYNAIFCGIKKALGKPQENMSPKGSGGSAAITIPPSLLRNAARLNLLLFFFFGIYDQIAFAKLIF